MCAEYETLNYMAAVYSVGKTNERRWNNGAL